MAIESRRQNRMAPSKPRKGRGLRRRRKIRGRAGQKTPHPDPAPVARPVDAHPGFRRRYRRPRLLFRRPAEEPGQRQAGDQSGDEAVVVRLPGTLITGDVDDPVIVGRREQVLRVDAGCDDRLVLALEIDTVLMGKSGGMAQGGSFAREDKGPVA